MGVVVGKVGRRAVPAVLQLATTTAERRQRPDDVLVGWFERTDAAVETVEEKRQLLSGLARVPTLDSLRLLERYLSDPDVETEAGYALLSVGSALVKAGQPAPVRRVLAEAPRIEDPELAWRLERLEKRARRTGSTR